MRRIIWSTLAVAILLAWVQGPALAQEGGPTMQVLVGFDGYCPSDGWCFIYVVLSNEGADIEGELRVEDSHIADHDVYAHHVLLPARSRKAYTLNIPRIKSALDVRLVADERVLAFQHVQRRYVNETDRLYGVASGSPSALNFLSDVAPAGSTAVVAHLDLETLPPNPLGWEGLDVLVLNDVDTTALSSQQREALETWVAHGGHLIVGGGAGAARTVAGVADLLPVTVGGTRSVDDLWALGERLGAPTAAGPYAVAEATLRDGEALIEQKDEQEDGQGDLILVARRSYGAGTVDFVAFDAGLNPFTRWNDNAHLWELIVGARTTGDRRLTVRNGHNARESINSIPGMELPSALQILAFMLVYTLLIGPVNYLVLRKLDRRELAWLTIPALVVGFTAIAYLTGFQIRGGMPIVHRLAVVYVPEGLPSASGGAGGVTGRVSQVVGLFSPRRSNYDVWVAGAGVREIPDDYYGGPAKQPLYVVEEAEGLTVTGLRVDVGGIRPFVTEGYVDVSAVEADLQLAVSSSGDLRVEGTLHNGESPLKDAVLIVGDRQQRLGDLEAGEEADVHLVYTSSSYSQPSISEQILGTVSLWEDRELYRRYQFIEALLSTYDRGLGLGKKVCLVGWAEEAPLPVEVVGRPFSTLGTTLYVYALPVAGLEGGLTVTIPPGLITRQVEETTGDVNVWPEGFHVGNESAVVLRFTVWEGVTVQQVDELVLDLQGSSYGNTSHPSHPPAVSLWNEESGAWEKLGVGWGQHSIPNAGAYVIPPGDVLLRLETYTASSADVHNLTITIKGQR